MTNLMEINLLRKCYECGIDIDGDIISYDGNLYYVNIKKNILEEVK